MRSAIDEAGAECALEIGDRLRDGRLSYRQVRRSLRHAAELRDGEQNLQVAQGHAPAHANVGSRGLLHGHKKFLYPYAAFGNSGSRTAPNVVRMANLTRRTALAGLASLAALRPDRAIAAWPERNITLLHGLAPGGGVDVTARIVAEGLSRRLGRPVVVESRPGAATTLAAAQIARAAPDGYTLGFVPISHAVAGATYKQLPITRSMISHSSARRPNTPLSWSPIPSMRSKAFPI